MPKAASTARPSERKRSQGDSSRRRIQDGAREPKCRMPVYVQKGGRLAVSGEELLGAQTVRRCYLTKVGSR